MKQKTRWHDALVLAAVLCAAFLIVTGTQQITGRIDGVASMVFVLAVFLISIYTDGYVWGVVASLIGVLAVNFAFRSPYFAFNFTLPENLFSGAVMLVVSIMTSTLTTRIKKQEQLRMESETEKMRANLLRAVSHDLRTPLTTLLLYTEIVRSRKYENDAQKDDYLNKIDTKARQLKQLSDNLFEYALVTRDTVVTLDPPAYFSRIFEEPLAEMVDTLQQRGFACALDLGSEDLMLTVKMQYIRRVFDNHVLPGQHREESTQVGLTSIETMMEKMNAVCRVEQGTEQFAITLLFPIT